MTVHLLHVFIVSGDAPSKCAAVLRLLQPDMTPAIRITFLSGAPAANDKAEIIFDGLSIQHHPGESIWHLRKRMVELAQDSEWMILLEDHNRPLPGWLPQLCKALQHTSPSVDALFGATDNLTSTGPWDWANYLAVQVFHWAPGIQEHAHPLPFNAAMRVSRLPPAPWEVGTFEAVAVAQVSQHAQFSPRFPVDHIQPRAFPSVLTYHFANGQATGAHLRIHSVHPVRKTAAHLIHVLWVRPLQSARILRQHPKRHLLPPGTWWRLPCLLWAHGAGTIFGFFFGAGRSMWLLE